MGHTFENAVLVFLFLITIYGSPTRFFHQTVQPRFQGENFDKNKTFYFRIEKLAEKHGCTTAQLALAWLLHQGDDVVPIPGECFFHVIRKDCFVCEVETVHCVVPMS